eukprot:9941334-Alexandrium_andersonii.AAC.1
MLLENETAPRIESRGCACGLWIQGPGKGEFALAGRRARKLATVVFGPRPRWEALAAQIAALDSVPRKGHLRACG